MRLRTVVALLLAIAATAPAQTVLSDNTTQASSGTPYSVNATAWEASSFATGSTSLTNANLTVSLLLARPVTNSYTSTTNGVNTATVQIYTDSAQVPGSLLYTLTAPTAYTTTASLTTFTGTGVTLSANTTYWVVLKGTGTTEFDWSSTLSETGTGVGFQHTHGETTNSGANWFTYDVDPVQMQVVALAVPEPASVLGVTALAGAGFAAWRKRREAKAALARRNSQPPPAGPLREPGDFPRSAGEVGAVGFVAAAKTSG